jgi:hypothetical protein
MFCIKLVPNGFQFIDNGVSKGIIIARIRVVLDRSILLKDDRCAIADLAVYLDTV